MSRGYECKCHKHKDKVPQEHHHVWPLGYHGPDEQSNIIFICCNAHSDIHYYMEYLLRHNGERPEDWRTYGNLVRQWAVKGYNEVIEYGNNLSREYYNV